MVSVKRQKVSPLKEDKSRQFL
jgi:predicted outer membrane protein